MKVFIVSLDPGIRHCGLALFVNRKLVKAGLARNPEASLRGPPAWMTMANSVEEMLTPWLTELGFVGGDEVFLAAEIPQVYRGPTKADPDDLMQLTGVVGAVTGLVSHAIGYFPFAWKKNIPKGIHQTRLRRRLDAKETAVLEGADCPPSLLHNVIDAVGIGLHHLLRLRVKNKDAT